MLWFWSLNDPAWERSSISPNISTPIPQCLAKSYSPRQPYSNPRLSVCRLWPTCAPKMGLSVSSALPAANSTMGPNSISSASPPRVAKVYPLWNARPRPLPSRSINSYCASSSTPLRLKSSSSGSSAERVPVIRKRSVRPYSISKSWLCRRNSPSSTSSAAPPAPSSSSASSRSVFGKPSWTAPRYSSSISPFSTPDSWISNSARARVLPAISPAKASAKDPRNNPTRCAQRRYIRYRSKAAPPPGLKSAENLDSYASILANPRATPTAKKLPGFPFPGHGVENVALPLVEGPWNAKIHYGLERWPQALGKLRYRNPAVPRARAMPGPPRTACLPCPTLDALRLSDALPAEAPHDGGIASGDVAFRGGACLLGRDPVAPLSHAFAHRP